MSEVVNGNAAGRILLGTAGWDRSDWLDAYYPPDLPAEWRLAYYANECNCVLLPATGWCGTDCERLGRAFAEAPEYLTVFLELSLDCRHPLMSLPLVILSAMIRNGGTEKRKENIA